MATARSSFESSLEDVGVSVTSVETASFREQLDETVTPPAVGVPLEEAFDEPSLSLADTSVTGDPTPATLREATTGVTGAQLGIGDYGSLALTPTDRASELVSLFVDRHVAVLRESDIVPDMDTAIETVHDEIDRTGHSVILATGPSATADMGALVTGAHGPRDVHVLIVDGE
ncbi:LUD domain-containing protein [Natrialba asiatica]|uniref:LUD domain-containing protein n=1 Tax=Natrialba asiatica (strain ATCC 700177 / DSM 12278 / JCM 9576 / FERM P-10747 / NBRC 102637 / 172P1) TaxID=29540 RepID=M0B579_NATA1|nr:LUD domain-containing protein [Natrialba asiatica]ELZ05960.1 hypothetical protein C481_00460 [Natrialba asiatica DSM 12278]